MANTQTGSLLKYMGLMGTSGVRTGSLVPRAQTPDAEQRMWQEFQESGRVADPDIWTKFNTVMKRPTTFEAMLQLWDEMSQWDLVAAALVEIVDEACQTDSNSPGVLWYQCNDSGFEEELNDMLVRVQADEVLQSQVWHVASLGNSFEKLEYAPQEGILGMSFVHPMDMRRYWLERNRKCIGFRWLNHKPNKEDVFVMPDNRTPVERVSLASGQHIEDLYYPWDFLHFRRMFRMRISEHGEPIFAEADGIYKKLRMAIDQMVVCRAQVQPDRYAISIDVQEQPPVEQMKTIQRWRQTLRSKLAFGQAGLPNDLNSASDFTSYYNALSLDTIIYLAQPKGFNNIITKLPGTPDVPDVYDIELLTDLFYSILGMPKAWFGSNDGGENFPSGKALLAQDIRFLRKIKSIRRPITSTYQWMGYFHAVLKGKNVEELDIKAMMSPIGSLEEQMKMEMLSMQADVLAKLGDVMEQYNLPKEAWIETVFKRYMHLPDEVVNVFLTALPDQVEQGQEESYKRRPAPATYKLLRQIDEAVKKVPGAGKVLHELKQLVRTERIPVSPPKKWTKREVLMRPPLQEDDVIISSFGKHPFDLKRSASKVNESKDGPGFVGGVIQKRINGGAGGKPGPWDDDGATPPAPVAEGTTRDGSWDKYRPYVGG
jgi:Bacteriophage T4-like portal protein (Gp20)